MKQSLTQLQVSQQHCWYCNCNNWNCSWIILGNKVKITGVTGTGSTIFNNDFIVQEEESYTVHVKASVGIPTTGVASAEVYKYNLGAYGQDSSLQVERIGGSLVNMTAGISTTTTAGIGTNEVTTQLTNTIGLSKGDFLQVDSEIVRIKAVDSGSQLTIIRGLLGTRSVPHTSGSILKKINIIPSEVRRYSSTRSSGQTFEYVGYGPGNYLLHYHNLERKQLLLKRSFLQLQEKQMVV